MEGKEKCMPEVPVSQWVCIFCLGAPSGLGKEGEPGWCRGKDLLHVGALNVNCLGQDSRGEQCISLRPLGKTRCWRMGHVRAEHDQLDHLSSASYLQLLLRGEMISKWLGMFKFIALFAGYWIKGKFTTWIP